MQAGTAKIDISNPNIGSPAYEVSDETREHIPVELWDKKVVVDDPLYLRVLLLDDGSQKYALITMDVTAIGARTITSDILYDSADDFLPKLRDRLQKETGIAPECVTVTASHTHPPGRLLCDDREQIERAVRAVNEAMARLEPVKIGISSAQERRLTFNRTLLMKDGSDYTIRECNPLPPDNEVEGLRPIDPEVGVLRVDRLDGTPLAIAYNFGSHLLLGTPGWNITADFIATTSGHLEDILGHDCLALFLQGAGGDSSEISQTDREHPCWGPEFGLVLSQSVLEAFRTAVPAEAEMAIVSETVSFPFRSDIPDQVASLRQEQAELMASLRYTSLNFKTFLPLYLKHTLHPDFPLHSAYRYLQAQDCGNLGFEARGERNAIAVEKYLSSMQAMERMARNEEKIATMVKQQEVIDRIGGSQISAEIQGIKIGEAVFITAPMEVLAETGLKLKKSSPFPRTFVISNSNGYLHYAPPADYYSRGGYESTESLLAPEWEKIFDEVVSRIFARFQKLK